MHVFGDGSGDVVGHGQDGEGISGSLFDTLSESGDGDGMYNSDGAEGGWGVGDGDGDGDGRGICSGNGDGFGAGCRYSTGHSE